MSCIGKLETAAITQLSKSSFTFNWSIANFDIICPENSKDFDIIKSPVFTAGEDINKKSKWLVHITGIAEHIACYLQLESAGQEGRSNKSISVPCSFKISFGNSENRFYFTRSISAHKFTRENNDWGYSKFISISDLYEKKENLLTNNAVHICVQMEVYGDPVNSTSTLSIKRKRESKQILETLSEDFSDLLKNKKYSDVEIRCGTKIFYAHKLILCARSKVFAAMFDAEMMEAKSSQVEIPDMDPEVVRAVLTYIYTGKMPECQSLPDLIYGAEKYDLPELKHHCFDILLETVTDDTVGNLAIYAQTYNADPETTTAVKKYCQSHISTLVKNPTFKKLLVSHPGAFFED